MRTEHGKYRQKVSLAEEAATIQRQLLERNIARLQGELETALQEKGSLLAEKEVLQQEVQKTYCFKAIFLKAAFRPTLLKFLFTYQPVLLSERLFFAIAVASVTHSPLSYYAYILTCNISSPKHEKGREDRAALQILFLNFGVDLQPSD